MQNKKEKLFLRIKNFKCLEDVELELKPITLLFGSNGSGKSSLLKAIRFLSHNLFSIHVDFIINGPEDKKYFNIDNNIDLVSYENIVTNNEKKRTIQFDIRLENSKVSYGRIKDALSNVKSVLDVSDDYMYINKKNKLRLEPILDKKKYSDRLRFDWNEVSPRKEKKKEKLNFTDEYLNFNVSVIFYYSKPNKINRPVIRLVISDISNNVNYGFTPNSADENNSYTYDKHIDSSNKFLEQLLSETLKYEELIPFVFGISGDYYLLDKRIKEAIRSFNQRVLKYIYENQNYNLWKNLSDTETWNLYSNTLKIYYNILFTIPKKIREHFHKVVHLPSIRKTPNSLYLMKEGKFRDEDYYGLLREYDPNDNLEGIPQKVSSAEISPIDEKGIGRVKRFSFTNFINFILRDMKLAKYIKIKVTRDRLAGYLYYKTLNSNATDNLSNASSGLLQILPILYKSYYSREKDQWDTVIRLIEQPELHLHPWLQCKLAEFFCHKELRDRSFIIETHSEHLLRKIQVLIAKANKKSEHEDLKDRVAVYYFNKNEKSDLSTVKEMKMDNLGRFMTSWPPGFFDIDTELTLDFYKQISKN